MRRRKSDHFDFLSSDGLEANFFSDILEKIIEGKSKFHYIIDLIAIITGYIFI